MTLTWKQLGLASTERAVIFHADDVGMCHGANVAFLELSRRGLITCGSVMVPCPWFLEAAAMACENPDLDLGVHLTLTSEWKYYRWGPISTHERASGLIDDEGYFYHRTHQVAEHLNLDAVQAEFRAQIETALGAGIDMTHLDTHMGVALIPGAMEIYARLGLEYRVPVLIPRQTDLYQAVLGIPHLDPIIHQATIGRLENLGMPMVDHFYISPGVPSAECEATYREMIAQIPAGLTFVSLHPNAPGDIETINPPRAFFRIDEFRLLQQTAFGEYVAEQKIRRMGYRQLRDLFRAALVRQDAR